MVKVTWQRGLINEDARHFQEDHLTIDKDKTNAYSNILPVHMRFTVDAVDCAGFRTIQAEVIEEAIHGFDLVLVPYVGMTFLVSRNDLGKARMKKTHSDGSWSIEVRTRQAIAWNGEIGRCYLLNLVQRTSRCEQTFDCTFVLAVPGIESGYLLQMSPWTERDFIADNAHLFVVAVMTAYHKSMLSSAMDNAPRKLKRCTISPKRRGLNVQLS